MPTIRPRSIWVIAAAVFLTCLGIYLMERSRSEAIKEKIRMRYDLMGAALSSGNDTAAAALIAPHVRMDPSDLRRLHTFATPLRADSVIRLSGSTAQVCPNPIRHWGFIPGGNTVEMAEVGGEWFFTGKVHID